MRRLGAAFSCVALAALAGCATRADLLEVQKDQRAVRALLADQQVAIDGLRRRVDMLRSEISEPGRGRRGASSSEAARQLNDLEARVAALEQGRATGALPGATPPGGEIERPPLEAAPRPDPDRTRQCKGRKKRHWPRKRPRPRVPASTATSVRD